MGHLDFPLAVRPLALTLLLTDHGHLKFLQPSVKKRIFKPALKGLSQEILQQNRDQFLHQIKSTFYHIIS
jgi:hypothetical protein